ncbi:MAG: N-acetyltransferase family protein [Microthrixaceae bacterium]
MQIRPAVTRDASEMMGIYNPVVLTSTATFDLVPRSLAEQEEWIEDRSGARIILVAVNEEDQVMGYSALSPYRDRAAYSTTVEDSVYVHEDFLQLGIGKLLLGSLIDTARAHGFHAMMARIVAGHEASLALHSQCGFVVVGYEREVGRKFGKWLDVTLMELLL